MSSQQVVSRPQEIVLGTHTNDPGRLLSIRPKDLLFHTLIVGQSGSGKSFFVARLLEELLARTRARIVIIDPNGDFRRFFQVSTSVWNQLADRFAQLAKLSAQIGALDTQPDFTTIWDDRAFTSLVAGERQADLPQIPGAANRRALQQPLLIHWDDLRDERDFLLRADATQYPRLSLGIEACKTYVAERLGKIDNSLKGAVGLQALDAAARERPTGMLDHEHWAEVSALVHEVEKRYSLWWPNKNEMNQDMAPTLDRPLGLCDYVEAAFRQGNEPEDEVPAWDVLTLSLDAAQHNDSLLAADVLLSRLWDESKQSLRRVMSSSQEGRDEETDNRVPTFVVVDEAHNFAPRHPQDPLQERVTKSILRIASEGRKYGLYLVLATQRPTKLNAELVPECENSCVLRVQSTDEQEFASGQLGIQAHRTKMADGFVQGQGLLHGRWMGGQTVDAIAAPARTHVGGGGIPDSWTIPRPSNPRIDTEEQEVADVPTQLEQLRDGVKDFVSGQLMENDGQRVRLTVLADQVRRAFPEAGPSGQWLGHGSFKEMLRDLGITNLGFEAKPLQEGWAFLSDSHIPNQDSGQSPEKAIEDAEPVTIDRSSLLPGSDLLSVPLSQDTTVNEFLNTVFDYISERVRPNTYGRSWVLADETTAYPEMGMRWARDHGMIQDLRPISSLGIAEGAHLRIVSPSEVEYLQ
jgi:hypothetical protein